MSSPTFLGDKPYYIQLSPYVSGSVADKRTDLFKQRKQTSWTKVLAGPNSLWARAQMTRPLRHYFDQYKEYKGTQKTDPVARSSMTFTYLMLAYRHGQKNTRNSLRSDRTWAAC